MASVVLLLGSHQEPDSEDRGKLTEPPASRLVLRVTQVLASQEVIYFGDLLCACHSSKPFM